MVPKVTFMANNQCSIRTQDGRYFQSYDSTCAHIKGREITLYKDWDYSRTTFKYLKQFLNVSLTKAEIQRKLGSGEYIKG